MKLTKVWMVLMTVFFSGYISVIFSQVKITDGTDHVPDINSILELESTSKGFLPPRVVINSKGQASPLTAPVQSGMMVYSIGGAVADGYYYWDGNSWEDFNSTESVFVKSASATLLKSERFVLTTGDVTLTLPAITESDNGLSITVKNIGTHTDLTIVQPGSGANIDGTSESWLTRWFSRTYIAYNGNWILKYKAQPYENTISVSEKGSFKTLKEAVEFLEAHMTKPMDVILVDKDIPISETITVNLPFPVTFEAVTYGMVTLGPATGMTGKPLFRCVTECYFKKIFFDGNMLPGYGTSTNEDAIQFTGSGTYHEVKDCSFDGFYNAIASLSDNELWLFECDIDNSENSGLIINSSSPGSIIKVSETDFTGNKTGVHLFTGSDATITLNSGFYSNANSSDVAILYSPSTFSFSNLVITGNSWNFIGTGISGFDFSRPDGRDIDAFIENNAGVEDEKPHCQIEVVNNSLVTTCTIAGEWYKANWTNTSSITTSFVIQNNKITYLPRKKRDLYIVISGDVFVNNSNRIITLGIVKNGNTTRRYGETALRIVAANQPFQFSTVIYIENVMENDYFELYSSSSGSGDLLNFQDINWYTSAQ